MWTKSLGQLFRGFSRDRPVRLCPEGIHRTAVIPRDFPVFPAIPRGLEDVHNSGCGILELMDGRPDQAWVSWRRSLELANSHLPEILDRSATLLTPHDILRRVLPNRSELLLKAASHLYPQPGEGRRPFLEQALAILEKQPDALGAADLHVKASIHRALGQPIEALAAYRASLDREPLQLARRYEFAELLYEQNRFQESFQELLKSAK